MATTPPTEAAVTAAKNPAGSATPSSPPKTEGNASATDKRFAEWGSDLSKPAGMKATNPRGQSGDGGNPSGSQGDAAKPADGGAPAAAGGKITVKYKGADREYDGEAARNLIQQGLALQDKHTALKPVIDGTEQLMQRIGVSDPQVFLNTIVAGLQALSEKQTGANARAAAPNGGEQIDPAAAQSAGNVDVNAALADFEKENGIVLTPAFKAMMTNIAKNSNSVAAVAGTLPTLQAQIEKLANGERLRGMKAQADAVNSAAVAARDKNNLTDDDYTDFQAFVDETDKVFPGFKTRIQTDPNAVTYAINRFAMERKGTAAIKTQAEMDAEARQRAGRAGGDTVSARGTGGAPGSTGSSTKTFNDEMLQSL